MGQTFWFVVLVVDLVKMAGVQRLLQNHLPLLPVRV